jgi:hypothetical protein
MKGPSKRICRGLDWIASHARADYQERLTENQEAGQFPGTSAGEVEDALLWLEATIRAAEGAKP